MKALHKKIVSAVLVCAGLVFLAGRTGREQSTVLMVNSAGEATYQQADTDMVFWYEDASYADFFESAAEQYFAKTRIKVAVEYQDTIDYIGNIYDTTMQESEYPDIYLISGDNLEEAYLYGLASVNQSINYEGAAKNAVRASSYNEKMIGYPLSYNSSLFIYQNGYFDNAPESLQAIIEYSDQNEPAEDVEYLLEWDVNDAFYDFPFVSNSVSFDKNQAQTMEVVYDEELYQQDLAYFEEILESFSVDADTVSQESIIENFLSGKTLCAMIDSNSLAKLSGYDYSIMEIPDLNAELPADSCGMTDMLVVNDFSENQEMSAAFAEFITIDLSEKLHEATGHYSVFLSKNADDIERIAYQSYENSVLVPDSPDAKDFWVTLKETIAQYF